MLDNIITFFLGSKHERDLKELVPFVQKINSHETEVMTCTEADFSRKTDEYRRRIAEGETLDSVLPEAFALVREAARRILGERIFDVQLIRPADVDHPGPQIIELRSGGLGRILIF